MEVPTNGSCLEWQTFGMTTNFYGWFHHHLLWLHNGGICFEITYKNHFWKCRSIRKNVNPMWTTTLSFSIRRFVGRFFKDLITTTNLIVTVMKQFSLERVFLPPIFTWFFQFSSLKDPVWCTYLIFSLNISNLNFTGHRQKNPGHQTRYFKLEYWKRSIADK